jgi:TolB-like protein
MKKLRTRIFFSFAVFAVVLLSRADARPVLYLTSGELSSGKSTSFAGGSACCGCRIDHYGQLPADFPEGKVSSVVFFLRGSRADSYYTRIKNGPNRLKLIVGNRSSVAMSQQFSADKELAIKAPWILDFQLSPPAPVQPGMTWKLLDGDNNIYSAVLLHSGDVDLQHGIRGHYKTYNCQYSRVEDQSYSVKFDFVETKPPVKVVDDKKTVRPRGKIRSKVYKTAVVEFTERGDLRIKDAGAIIAEWMTTSLDETGAFEVYERLSLAKLMEEHQLEMSGLMDDDTIAKIGRIHGVQAIITGSVIKFGDIISVTAKVIDVETAKIVDSADVKVKDVNALSSEIENLAWCLAID